MILTIACLVLAFTVAAMWFTRAPRRPPCRYQIRVGPIETILEAATPEELVDLIAMVDNYRASRDLRPFTR